VAANNIPDSQNVKCKLWSNADAGILPVQARSDGNEVSRGPLQEKMGSWVGLFRVRMCDRGQNEQKKMPPNKKRP
jgi:hypothetical protein